MLTEVSSNETQHKEDGTFLRKLIIDSVTEDDAGTYFCMAHNPSGFTLSATELIVSDREYPVHLNLAGFENFNDLTNQQIQLFEKMTSNLTLIRLILHQSIAH